MKTLDIKMNTAKWECCVNRHTTTRGYSWGWIEGAGNTTWSDDPGSPFTSKDASAAVKEHNDWLEDSRPAELKLIDARNLAYRLQQEVNDKRAALRIAEEKLTAVHATIRALDAIVSPNP